MKLITEKYRELNQQLHESKHKYGQRGHRHLDKLKLIKGAYDCSTVLDYGCGTATLARHASFTVKNYDPAIPQYSSMPDPADLVVCTDVLEHIECDLLDNVLSHLQDLTLKVGFFVVATRPDTSKTLPDGTNPHKIIESPGWWTTKLSEYFTIESAEGKGGEVEIIVT